MEDLFLYRFNYSQIVADINHKKQHILAIIFILRKDSNVHN